MPEEKRTKERLHHIDFIEALAIFFVVFYHGDIAPTDFLSTGRGIDYFRFVAETAMSACVPLFFLANGYLLLNRPLDMKKHLVKTLRLVVIVVVWSVIYAVAEPLHSGDSLSLWALAEDVWKGDLKWGTHLWFMRELVILYIIFPVLKAAYDQSRRAIVWLVCAAALLTIGNQVLNMCATVGMDVIFARRSVWTIDFFNRFNPFFRYHDYSWVYFCLGGLLSAVEDRIRAVPAKKRNFTAAGALVVSTALLGLWGIYCARITGNMPDAVYDFYNTVFTLSNVLSLYVLSLNYRAVRRGLRRGIEIISRNTMGIYFVHYLAIHLTRAEVMKFAPMNSFIGAAVYAAAILGLSLLVTMLLKKIPVLRWMVR